MTTTDTRCPRCGVTIRWTVTLAGARLAIDPTSHADGVVVPVWVGGELRAKVLTGNELPAQTAAYLPHERTCVKGRQRARRAGLRKPRCPWCEALMDPWLVDQGARGHVNCMSERAWQSSNLSVKGAAA